MSVLWEILQSGFIYKQHRQAGTIEERIQFLEEQQQKAQETLELLVKKIEEIHGLDIDGDGSVG